MKAGWKRAKLGDVCHVYQPETLSQKQLKEGPYPVYGANGQIGFHNEFNHAEPQLTLGCRGTCGVVNWTTQNAWINGNAMVVKAVEELVTPQFLSYALKGGINIGDSISGTAQPQITRKSLTQIEIPLPPLAEQKRIVALLDVAFAGIDEAKAKAETSLEKAKAVFESHLQSLFENDSAGWVEGKLSSLTTKIGSGATPRGGEESYKNEGVSLIRSLNVHDLGFKYVKLAFLDETQANELSGVTVQEDDVLLNITGASVARCTIVPRGVLPARVNQHVAIIRPIREKVCSAFLHYLLISKPYKSRLLETGEEGGSTRQAITKAQLQEFTISHPVSTEAQQAIATHIDEILDQTQRLSELHSQRIEAFSALRSSILAQAFAGELTA